jgi:hypothetical protein
VSLPHLHLPFRIVQPRPDCDGRKTLHYRRGNLIRPNDR